MKKINRVKDVVKKLDEKAGGRSFFTPAEWQEVHRWATHGGNLTQLYNALPGPKHSDARSFMSGYCQWKKAHASDHTPRRKRRAASATAEK